MVAHRQPWLGELTMERWAIDLRRENFRFSCAHFLIFPEGRKERLHGHNYRMGCRITGDLDERGLVLDFNQVKPVVRALCDELDERWLIPDRHPDLRWRQRDDGHTEIVYGDCRYLAPSDEVLVLPLTNISVENLAAWLGRRLREELIRRFGIDRLRRLRVWVSESEGQAGVWSIDEP